MYRYDVVCPFLAVCPTSKSANKAEGRAFSIGPLEKNSFLARFNSVIHFLLLIKIHSIPREDSRFRFVQLSPSVRPSIRRQHFYRTRVRTVVRVSSSSREHAFVGYRYVFFYGCLIFCVKAGPIIQKQKNKKSERTKPRTFYRYAR